MSSSRLSHAYPSTEGVSGSPLDPSQRSRLMRSTRKLGSILGTPVTDSVVLHQPPARGMTHRPSPSYSSSTDSYRESSLEDFPNSTFSCGKHELSVASHSMCSQTKRSQPKGAISFLGPGFSDLSYLPTKPKKIKAPKGPKLTKAKPCSPEPSNKSSRTATQQHRPLPLFLLPTSNSSSSSTELEPPSPVSPLPMAPNASQRRKMAKLARQLGQPVPTELVFPTRSRSSEDSLTDDKCTPQISAFPFSLENEGTPRPKSRTTFLSRKPKLLFGGNSAPSPRPSLPVGAAPPTSYRPSPSQGPFLSWTPSPFSPVPKPITPQSQPPAICRSVTSNSPSPSLTQSISSRPQRKFCAPSAPSVASKSDLPLSQSSPNLLESAPAPSFARPKPFTSPLAVAEPIHAPIPSFPRPAVEAIPSFKQDVPPAPSPASPQSTPPPTTKLVIANPSPIVAPSFLSISPCPSPTLRSSSVCSNTSSTSVKRVSSSPFLMRRIKRRSNSLGSLPKLCGYENLAIKEQGHAVSQSVDSSLPPAVTKLDLELERWKQWQMAQEEKERPAEPEAQKEEVEESTVEVEVCAELEEEEEEDVTLDTGLENEMEKEREKREGFMGIEMERWREWEKVQAREGEEGKDPKEEEPEESKSSLKIAVDPERTPTPYNDIKETPKPLQNMRPIPDTQTSSVDVSVPQIVLQNPPMRTSSMPKDTVSTSKEVVWGPPQGHYSRFSHGQERIALLRASSRSSESFSMRSGRLLHSRASTEDARSMLSPLSHIFVLPATDKRYSSSSYHGSHRSHESNRSSARVSIATTNIRPSSMSSDWIVTPPSPVPLPTDLEASTSSESDGLKPKQHISVLPFRNMNASALFQDDMEAKRKGKSSSWRGEWNLEDIKEVQKQLRDLRFR